MMKATFTGIYATHGWSTIYHARIAYITKLMIANGGKEKMAITKKKEEKKYSYEVEVKRVNRFEKSDDIAVDMIVNGVYIYNCIYKEGKNDKGDYAFISFPSRKGNDDKYYNHVWFKIDEDLLEDIEKQIEAML